MENVKVVYKRTSGWWLATCYLVGSFFLLLWAVVSLLDMAATLGKDGVVALKKAADEQQVERALAARYKDQVQLTAFNVSDNDGVVTLAVSIKNDSKFAVKNLSVEVAQLDAQGIPLQREEQWLSNLDTVYPGDTGHTREQLSLPLIQADVSYQVRINRFDVVGDEALKAACEALTIAEPAT